MGSVRLCTCRIRYLVARGRELHHGWARNSPGDAVSVVGVLTTGTTAFAVLIPPTVRAVDGAWGRFWAVPLVALAWVGVVTALICWSRAVWGADGVARDQRAARDAAILLARSGRLFAGDGIGAARREVERASASLGPVPRAAVRREADHLVDQVQRLAASCVEAGVVVVDRQRSELRVVPEHAGQGSLMLELIALRRHQLLELAKWCDDEGGSGMLQAQIAAQWADERAATT